MIDFKDKVVIVTGGTRGIGLETVKSFYKNNAVVILFGSKKESVEKTILELRKENIEVEGYYPNLNNYEEINNIIKKIYNKYGHIDVLINNVGVSDKRKLEDISSLDFSNIMNTNINSMFNMSKAVVPYMKKQHFGVILNASSMVSIYGQPSGVPYPASKSAVNGLTKSLARELAPFNIRVNAVAPGIIKTDMLKDISDDIIKPLIDNIPLGRIGLPSDIANAYLFLASDMASYITGVILQVDGCAKN